MGTTPPIATHAELLAEWGWLRRLARALVSTGGEAEDAAQDALVAALEHTPSGDRPLRPWLARVLVNRVRRQRRDAASRPGHAEVEAESELPSPDQLVQRMELQQAVIRAVLGLDEPGRSNVLLHYFHGLSAVEIAARTGTTPAAVRQRLSRARERLREALDEQCEGRAAWLGLLTAFARSTEAGPQPSALTALLSGVLSMKLVVAALLALTLAAVFWGSGTPRIEAVHLRDPDSPPRDGLERAAGPTTAGADGSERRVDEVGIETSGAPVAGVVLVALRGDGPLPDEVAFVETRTAESPWPELHYQAIDGRGRARFDDVPVGEARVGLLRATARAVTVRPGAEVRVEFDVAVGFDVEVVVVDESDAVAAGADVWLSESVDLARGDVRHGPAARPVRGAIVARTDDLGRVRITKVQAEHWIGARKPGVGVAPLRRLHDVSAGRKSLRLVLVRGTALRGGVVDAQDRPVEGAAVFVDAPSGPRSATSDSGGRFEMPAMSRERVRLLVRAPGYAVHRREVDLSGDAEVTIRLAASPRVAGRVLGSHGEPVAGAVVRWVDARLATPVGVRSDSEARFELAGLPAGSVRLEALHPTAGRAEVELELAPDTQTPWDAHLTAPARLVGRVVDGTGRPLAGWEVAVRPEGKSEEYETITRTRADGGFELSPVPQRLRLHAYPPRAWTEFPAGVLRDVDPSAGPVEVVVGDALEDSGTLAGRVVDAHGEPVSDALVGVWHQVHKIWRGARPDADGRFSLEHVPPGDVTLQIDADAYPSVGLGEPTIEVGEILDVGTVRLASGGTLRILLEGLSDESASRVEVELDGAELLLGSELSRDGREFRSGPLPGGEFDVHVEGDFVESTQVRCEVLPGRETEVRIPLRAAGMRRLRLVLPEGPDWPYAIEAELFDGERKVWNGWTSLDTLEPIEFRVSAVPGEYRLLVRGRYGEEPRLHLGTFAISGFDGEDPLQTVTLRDPE